MPKRISTKIQLVGSAVVFLVTATAAAAQQDTTSVQDTTAAHVFTDTTFVDDTTQIQEAHPQDSPERRGFLIVTGNGKSSLRIRGSLRVNGDYDFRGLQSAENFNTFEIPVGAANTADPRFFMKARQTRLGLEVTSDTDVGGLFLRVETDFLGENNALRLRHAFGSVGRFLVGQTWSTFGDLASLPLTVDLDGPNSSVAVRTVQVRYSVETDGYRFSVAAEAPGPEVVQIDTLGAKLDFQVTPDMVARVRKFGGWGHLQVASVFRAINVKDAADDLQVLPGFGALLSGAIEISEPDVIMWQLVGGYSISRFITALAGQGLDVVLNPITGRWETVTSFGGYASFGHTWQPGLVSYLTAGVVKVMDKEWAPDDAFGESGYASGNVFWEAVEGTRLGTEFSWGIRKNKDDQTGAATRLSFVFYLDFQQEASGIDFRFANALTRPARAIYRALENASDSLLIALAFDFELRPITTRDYLAGGHGSMIASEG